MMTMTAPVEQPAAERFPLRAPFTVDLLFDLPESAERYEVLEGLLVVSPAPEPKHNLAADRLGRLLDPLLPDGVEVITNTAIRMPENDGAIPDLLVTSADPEQCSRGIPHDLVHTVVEVVSPSHPTVDRVVKKNLYAAAGIPCYWRVELRPWLRHLKPLPAIVVHMLDDNGDWQETIYGAGTTSTLPLVTGHRGPNVLAVELDPAALVGPRRR